MNLNLIINLNKSILNIELITFKIEYLALTLKY